MKALLLTSTLAVAAAFALGVKASSEGQAAVQERRTDMSKTNSDLRTATFAGGCFWCTEADFEKLAKEVGEHEPRVALDGGPGGLREIARLIEAMPGRMNADGLLFLEIGHGQDVAVIGMLEKNGFVEAHTESDLAGKKRYAVARWPS